MTARAGAATSVAFHEWMSISEPSSFSHPLRSFPPTHPEIGVFFRCSQSRRGRGRARANRLCRFFAEHD